MIYLPAEDKEPERYIKMNAVSHAAVTEKYVWLYFTTDEPIFIPLGTHQASIVLRWLEHNREAVT